MSYSPEPAFASESNDWYSCTPYASWYQNQDSDFNTSGLGHFERLIEPDSSKRINQNAPDKFVLDRGSEVKKITLNQDIRNLNAFLHWAMKNRFIAPGLEIKKVKVVQKPVMALTAQQVQVLLSATARYPTLRLRVLLAVTTRLRRGDMESIRIGDMHFDRNTVTTQNHKAGKAMAERPIPEQIMTELSNHVATLPDGQERLSKDRFSPKKWEKIRKTIGLPELKFHDLRKTFASLLAERCVDCGDSTITGTFKPAAHE